MKKLTFEKQIIVGVAFLLLMHICASIFKRGFFINIGWVAYGLAFILHPVYPEKGAGIRHIRLWMRAAGLFCLLVGLLIRFMI